MQVTVLYFAAVRELRGADREELELPDEGATVAGLRAHLERSHAVGDCDPGFGMVGLDLATDGLELARGSGSRQGLLVAQYLLRIRVGDALLSD